jgi:hypothetical protein
MAFDELSTNEAPTASPVCRLCNSTTHLIPEVKFRRAEGATWGGQPYTASHVCIQCRLNQRGVEFARYNPAHGKLDVLIEGKVISRAASYVQAEGIYLGYRALIDEGETTVELLAQEYREEVLRLEAMARGLAA